MKKLIILLGMFAGVATSSTVQASPDDQSTKSRDARARAHMVAKASRPQQRTVYYTTTESVAGSHIPTVVRVYRGERDPVNGGFLPNRTLNTGQLNRSNGTSIGASLAQLDPAITVH